VFHLVARLVQVHDGLVDLRLLLRIHPNERLRHLVVDHPHRVGDRPGEDLPPLGAPGRVGGGALGRARAGRGCSVHGLVGVQLDLNGRRAVPVKDLARPHPRDHGGRRPPHVARDEEHRVGDLGADRRVHGLLDLAREQVLLQVLLHRHGCHGGGIFFFSSRLHHAVLTSPTTPPSRVRAGSRLNPKS